MPTTKTRINISAPRPVLAALKSLARRDDVPVATKTLELVKQAIEMEEDFVCGEIAKKRAVGTRQWISHRDFWRSANGLRKR